MIRKYSTRCLVFTLITVFVAFIGVFLYKNIVDINDTMARIKSEGKRVEATMKKLDTVTYDEQPHKWGYDIPGVGNDDADEIDSATISNFTVAEYEEMGGKIEVYYMYDGETLVSYDARYADAFKPFVPSQGILLFTIAGITFAVVLYYFARNMAVMYILRKGEESIGMFEEAVNTKFGSHKFYKVKYTFLRDGERVTVYSPPYYTSTQVDKLKDYNSFPVRYIGKYSVIDQKL